MAKKIIEIRKVRGGKAQAHLLTAKGEPAWSTKAYDNAGHAKRAARRLADLFIEAGYEVEIIDKTAR